MTTLHYPSNYAPVAEEEMVYIDGGAESSQVYDAFKICVGVAIVAIAFGTKYALDKAESRHEKRLQQEYEQATSLPAMSSDGAPTSDYANYKMRSELQGRDKASDTYMAFSIWVGLLGLSSLYVLTSIYPSD
ncbi:MAG: hypothetical protein PUF15_10595 [Faecalibacterium prausnitzii]|nr:hypothetical protein [Faecalibacterium prausnitzii]